MSENNVTGVCGEQRVHCVIFLYQHQVSRCESAADLVHFSPSAIKATVLQLSTWHPIVPSKRFGIEGSSQATSFRTPLLTRVKCRVSIMANMHHTVASHTPAKQHYLSAPRQALAWEYIIHSLYGDLDGKFLLWLHNAKLRYMLHTELYGGLRSVLWIMQHDIV